MLDDQLALAHSDQTTAVTVEDLTGAGGRRFSVKTRIGEQLGYPRWGVLGSLLMLVFDAHTGHHAPVLCPGAGVPWDGSVSAVLRTRASLLGSGGYGVSPPSGRCAPR
jgi:hypothetical protein